ncbi:hypothetical protein RUND412_007820 [Rhizina undulata]
MSSEMIACKRCKSLHTEEYFKNTAVTRVCNECSIALRAQYDMRAKTWQDNATVKKSRRRKNSPSVSESNASTVEGRLSNVDSHLEKNVGSAPGTRDTSPSVFNGETDTATSPNVVNTESHAPETEISSGKKITRKRQPAKKVSGIRKSSARTKAITRKIAKLKDLPIESPSSKDNQLASAGGNEVEGVNNDLQLRKQAEREIPATSEAEDYHVTGMASSSFALIRADHEDDTQNEIEEVLIPPEASFSETFHHLNSRAIPSTLTPELTENMAFRVSPEPSNNEPDADISTGTITEETRIVANSEELVKSPILVVQGSLEARVGDTADVGSDHGRNAEVVDARNDKKTQDFPEKDQRRDAETSCTVNKPAAESLTTETSAMSITEEYQEIGGKLAVKDENTKLFSTSDKLPDTAEMETILDGNQALILDQVIIQTPAISATLAMGVAEYIVDKSPSNTPDALTTIDVSPSHPRIQVDKTEEAGNGSEADYPMDKSEPDTSVIPPIPPLSEPPAMTTEAPSQSRIPILVAQPSQDKTPEQTPSAMRKSSNKRNKTPTRDSSHLKIKLRTSSRLREKTIGAREQPITLGSESTFPVMDTALGISSEMSSHAPLTVPFGSLVTAHSGLAGKSNEFISQEFSPEQPMTRSGIKGNQNLVLTSEQPVLPVVAPESEILFSTLVSPPEKVRRTTTAKEAESQSVQGPPESTTPSTQSVSEVPAVSSTSNRPKRGRRSESAHDLIEDQALRRSTRTLPIAVSNSQPESEPFLTEPESSLPEPEPFSLEWQPKKRSNHLPADHPTAGHWNPFKGDHNLYRPAPVLSGLTKEEINDDLAQMYNTIAESKKKRPEEDASMSQGTKRKAAATGAKLVKKSKPF